MNRKRARKFAWFGVVCIFVAGMISGLVLFRIFAGEIVGRMLMDEKRDVVEDWFVMGLTMKGGIATDKEQEIRDIFRQAQREIQSFGLKAHGDHANVLEHAVNRYRALVPAANREAFEYDLYRLLIAAQHPLIAAFAGHLRLYPDEQFELNRLMAKHYAEIQGARTLSHEELMEMPKKSLIASLPEIRALLDPKRQAELDKLGPNLERLPPYSRATLFDPEAVPPFRQPSP